jgi:ClpP class serine protease
VAGKAVQQVERTVFNLVRERLGEARGQELAQTLSDGQWTHDYPITKEEAKALGFPVRTGLPEQIYELMRLYPQPAQRRPSVEYVPTRYHPLPHDGVGSRSGVLNGR